MGQQFRPIIGGIYGGDYRSYVYQTKDECICTKIMEHSWWNNKFVNTISYMLYNCPKRVCWVGEYSEEKDFKFDVPDSVLIPSYEDIYGEDEDYRDIEEFIDFTLDGKYLVNFDTEEYIDLDLYKKKSFGRNDEIIHPLPLLTAIGNGDYLGDYHDYNKGFKFVGKWAWQLLAILDKAPSNFTKIDLIFSELKYTDWN